MAESLLVSTRKGLFTIARTGSARNPWAISKVDFLADNVSLPLLDRGDGRFSAALDQGLLGVRLHRSLPGGGKWEESAPPAYPPKPEGLVDNDGWGKPIP